MEPGNYTCIILLPGNYSLLPKFGTSFNFEVMRILFCLLVVSTISTVSMVSTIGQQALLQFHFLSTPH